MVFFLVLYYYYFLLHVVYYIFKIPLYFDEAQIVNIILRNK